METVDSTRHYNTRISPASQNDLYQTSLVQQCVIWGATICIQATATSTKRGYLLSEPPKQLLFALGLSVGRAV